MSLSLAPTTQTKRRTIASVVVPSQHLRSAVAYHQVRLCVIIPTYAPDAITQQLVVDLLRWNPRIMVYVVDDCTPTSYQESALIFQKLVALSSVTVLRTPENTLKAGALNYALSTIAREKRDYMPEVILTADDDIVIEQSTIKNLVIELLGDRRLGAVCSQCAVLNKNTNLLTRLQGLEYVGFNAIRLADEGFLQGPLVMHGMLTAFRESVLKQVCGFTQGHLIEDYEITTRLKVCGWHVKSATNAVAWTVVPDTISKFWKQRTRWSYGGITVVVGTRQLSAVFQDVVGHMVFLLTIGIVLFLLFSRSAGIAPRGIIQWIVALSLVQLCVWYFFQLWLMRLYKERDRFDWIIRLSLIPEFAYGYVMTFALIGSYFFLLFNALAGLLSRVGGTSTTRLVARGRKCFAACGYTQGEWGTRTIS